MSAADDRRIAHERAHWALVAELLPSARAEMQRQYPTAPKHLCEPLARSFAQLQASKEMRKRELAKKAACLDGVALTPGQHADFVELNHRSLRRAA